MNCVDITKKDEKLLSVIIPVYNTEQYLLKCISSVLDQTYQHMEIFLIDDGSTDNSGRICDEYAQKDSRIYVIHKENGGQGAARNCALDRIRGDYIAFVDSDDYLEKDMYTTMIDAIERTNSDLSLCGFATHSGLRIIHSGCSEREFVMDSAEELMRRYFDSPFIGGAPWNKIYRKELFDSIRFPEGVAREDIYIMYRLLGSCKRAVHTGKPLYHYIIRDGSSEHQAFQTKYLISIDIADQRCEYIRENFPELLELAEIACYGARLSAIRKIVRSSSVKKYKSIYDDLVEYIKTHTAPTKEYERQRKKILYHPFMFTLEMNIKHKYRKRLKECLIKIKNMILRGK